MSQQMITFMSDGGTVIIIISICLVRGNREGAY